jgi:hypothetical protein
VSTVCHQLLQVHVNIAHTLHYELRASIPTTTTCSIKNAKGQHPPLAACAQPPPAFCSSNIKQAQTVAGAVTVTVIVTPSSRAPGQRPSAGRPLSHAHTITTGCMNPGAPKHPGKHNALTSTSVEGLVPVLLQAIPAAARCALIEHRPTALRRCTSAASFSRRSCSSTGGLMPCVWTPRWLPPAVHRASLPRHVGIHAMHAEQLQSHLQVSKCMHLR